MAVDLDRIFEMLTEMLVEQGKLSTRQDATYDIVEKLEEKVGEQNGRVDNLEGWLNKLAGGWIVLVMGIGAWMKWG